jgi:hypothetical protein
MSEVAGEWRYNKVQIFENQKKKGEVFTGWQRSRMCHKGKIPILNTKLPSI